MSKYFDENAREQLQTLKEDVADYQKDMEQEKKNVIDARENLHKSEVRWAKAVIELDEFKTEYGL